MKNKITVLSLLMAFAFATAFGVVSAAETGEPGAYQSGVEGNSSAQAVSEAPAPYQSGVEGDNTSNVPANDAPPAYQSGVEGDNGSSNVPGDDVPPPYQSGVEGENEEQPSSNNGGSTSYGSRGSRSSSRGGEVLGATTDEGSCKMVSFAKIGQANDVENVKLIQSFLNTNLGISLPVTGFFGELTKKAVEDFQLKYKDETLKPWVDAGLHSSIDIPTGYVYKTTTYTINKMLCPDAVIAEPVLP